MHTNYRKDTKIWEKPSFVYPEIPSFLGNACSSCSLYCTYGGCCISEITPTLAALWYFCSDETQENAPSRLLEVIP